MGGNQGVQTSRYGASPVKSGPNLLQMETEPPSPMLDQPVAAVLRVSGPNSAALHLLVQTRLGLCSPAFSFSIFRSFFHSPFSHGARTNFSCGFRCLLAAFPFTPCPPRHIRAFIHHQRPYLLLSTYLTVPVNLRSSPP